jgi:hypothetical protein
MAPFHIPVIATEGAAPRWLPLNQLPVVADLVQKELTNDRELLATLRRGLNARDGLGGEDLVRLKEHLQEQVEFNALHREQIGHWLGADLSDADATLLDQLSSNLTELDDVLDQALATISRKC